MFLTTYALILPAITIDKQTFAGSAGMVIEEAALSAELQEAPAFLTGEITVSGEDFSITAHISESACLPCEARLRADEITGEEYDIYYAQALEALGAKSMPYARFFDIRFEVMNDGVWTEVEPQDTVSITIDTGRPAAEGENPVVLHYAETVSEESEENAVTSGSEELTGASKAPESEELTGASENSENAETSGFPEIAETPETSPEHRGTTDSRDSLDEEAVSLTGEMQVTEIPASQEEGELEITFETQSFSVFGVGYTVDYTYGGQSYSMPGGSAILLSKLLQKIGRNVDLAHVTNVVSNNPSLLDVSASEAEHDWVLLSKHQPGSENSEGSSVRWCGTSWMTVEKRWSGSGGSILRAGNAAGAGV